MNRRQPPWAWIGLGIALLVVSAPLAILWVGSQMIHSMNEPAVHSMMEGDSMLGEGPCGDWATFDGNRLSLDCDSSSASVVSRSSGREVTVKAKWKVKALANPAQGVSAAKDEPAPTILNDVDLTLPTGSKTYEHADYGTFQLLTPRTSKDPARSELYYRTLPAG